MHISYIQLQTLITKAKTNHFTNEVRECSGHQGRIFKIVAHLQNIKGKPSLPQYDNTLDLCNTFNDFFMSKIENIRVKLDQITSQNQTLSSNSHPVKASSDTFSGKKLTKFTPISPAELSKVVKDSSNASCAYDPLPTKTPQKLPA